MSNDQEETDDNERDDFWARQDRRVRREAAEARRLCDGFDLLNDDDEEEDG